MCRHLVRNFKAITQSEKQIKWRNNMKRDHKEIVCKGINRIILAHDREQRKTHVKTAVNLRVPQKAENVSAE
jgi:hypothetical protein